MHRWLLILMVALLPLRGWVGDAMAGELLAQHLGAAQGAVARPHAMHMAVQPSHQGNPHHHDCLEHVQATGEESGAAQGDVQGEVSPGSTCSSCQVCSSPALASDIEIGPAAALAPARPAARDARFASADRAPGLKPPIS